MAAPPEARPQPRSASGLITTVRIVPPTSQNQPAIEADLRAFAEAWLDLDDAELTRQCDRAIRNYDRCIPCPAYFLDLTVERSLFDTERSVVPVSGPSRGPVVVIGVGNEFRRDDGAGPAVIDRLRDLVPAGVELLITDGEPTRLIEAWTGTALAVVVDAVRAEPPRPGQVHRFVMDRPAGGAARSASSHGFGLDDAIALALVLDRMPAPDRARDRGGRPDPGHRPDACRSRRRGHRGSRHPGRHRVVASHDLAFPFT